MIRLPPVYRWLALAALAEWLIARTLTRSAIFMPKAPPVIVLYQALTFAGQLSAALTSLLALAAVLWTVWHSWRAERRIGLALALLSQTAVSFISLFVAPSGGLAVAYQLLAMAAIILMGVRAWREAGAAKTALAWSVPALALLFGALYQLLPALYPAMRWPGPPPFTDLLFNLGEAIVILSPMALWWAHGRGASRRAWTLAALPALAFSVMHLVNPAMTGIVAIWSTGLTLYLPWPAYAVSVWLAGVTMGISLRRGDMVGWGILLLAAGGYAPQFSTQAFVGLIALWLLGSPEAYTVVAADTTSAPLTPVALTPVGGLKTNAVTG